MNQKRQSEDYGAKLMPEQDCAESAHSDGEPMSPVGMTKPQCHAGQGQAKKGGENHGVQVTLAGRKAAEVRWGGKALDARVLIGKLANRCFRHGRLSRDGQKGLE